MLSFTLACDPLEHTKPETSPSLTPALLFLAAVQFTGDWETGWVKANTSYKSFSHDLVTADIGLHVGLGGVNITLMGKSDIPVCSSGAAMAPGGL